MDNPNFRNTGKTHFKKGHTPWNKGKGDYMRGDRNHQWKGGITEKLYKRMRRTQLRQLGGYTVEKIQMVYEDNIKKYGTLTCIYCFKKILFGKDVVEHKIPLSRGGNNDYNHLAIACRSCNCKKYNKTYDEYMAQLQGGKKWHTLRI